MLGKVHSNNARWKSVLFASAVTIRRLLEVLIFVEKTLKKIGGSK
jgi:hypothetical protein